MLRIVFLLIAIFEIALAQSHNNGTVVTVGEIPNNSTTNNSTTIEPVTSPNITTLSPTTTKPTTVSPTTASTPTPTVPPTQSPVIWTGNVTKDTNNTCINVKFMAQITIKYNTSKTTEMTTAFNIPANASVNEDKSYCSDKNRTTEVIFISFVDEEYTSADLMLKFNNSNGNVFVEEIELTFNLTKALFPDYFDPTQYDKMMKVTKNDLKLFSVGNSHSYLCSDAQTASLEDKNKGLETEIRFTNSQVEAYIDITKKGKFDSEINCKTTEINDVVPIAVGAALAGLVVIVLIAYFIGRRRSRRLAYQSV